MRQVLGRCVCALIVGLLVSTGVGVARADYLSGPWKDYGPWSGWNYSNQSSIGNDTRMFASTYAKTAQGYDAPSGWIGIRPRLFFAAGESVCRVPNGFVYNAGPASGFSAPTQGDGCPGEGGPGTTC